jgi:hypothetical protein
VQFVIFLQKMAEIECKGKNKSKNRGNYWVASPFGLRSGLRQSGSAFRRGVYGRAEARPFRDGFLPSG